MKKIQIKATTGAKGKPDYKEVVGEVAQYESTGEAIKALKEEVVLNLINRQLKTDALNAIRKPSSGGLGKLIAKVPPEARDQLREQILATFKKLGIAV